MVVVHPYSSKLVVVGLMCGIGLLLAEKSCKYEKFPVIHVGMLDWCILLKSRKSEIFLVVDVLLFG